MQDKFSNCRTCPAFAGHLKILRDKTLKCRTCPANAGRLATLLVVNGYTYIKCENDHCDLKMIFELVCVPVCVYS